MLQNRSRFAYLEKTVGCASFYILPKPGKFYRNFTARPTGPEPSLGE